MDDFTAPLPHDLLTVTETSTEDIQNQGHEQRLERRIGAYITAGESDRERNYLCK